MASAHFTLRQQVTHARFVQRLVYLEGSYRFAKAIEKQYGSINDNIELLRHAVNPRASRMPQRKRLHPILELAIKLRWDEELRAANDDDPRRQPTSDDMFRIAIDLADRARLIRGRPTASALTLHVHGLMLACQEACGIPVTASKTKNSLYDPHLHGLSGKALLQLAQNLEPTVTETAIVNIVLAAKRSSNLDGKRFGDLFPLCGGRVDADTGMPVAGPGYRLEGFEPAYPIYCS